MRQLAGTKAMYRRADATPLAEIIFDHVENELTAHWLNSGKSNTKVFLCFILLSHVNGIQQTAVENLRGTTRKMTVSSTKMRQKRTASKNGDRPLFLQKKDLLCRDSGFLASG